MAPNDTNSNSTNMSIHHRKAAVLVLFWILVQSSSPAVGFHNNNNNQLTPRSRLPKPHPSPSIQADISHGGASSKSEQQQGTATIPNEIFNLVKSIVGAGVLSLPAGIAAFGNAPSALLPAIVLIAIMGAISAYTFSMIARVCRMTHATSYADCWDKTRGNMAWIVAASSALDCFAGNLTYSMVLADTCKDLLAAFGIVTTRSKALLALTSVVLLPLCLVKNLASLAPFSLVGIMGMVYTSIAIGTRYFGGDYIVPTGKFVQDLAPGMIPSFGSTGAMGALSPKSLILVSMLSTAYIAHFNAPKFYRELKNNTMARFNTVVASSFGLSIAFYALVSSMGFLTFGSATAAMILNNYSTKDTLISLSRFAVGLSLIFSYPLLFVGTRDGLLDLAQVPESKRSVLLLNQITVGLVAILTGLALKVTDLTFVASMSGALLGTSLIFIFPTLMFRAAVANSKNPTRGQQLESRLCAVIAALGVAIAGVGTKMALQ
ncbi:Putative sodium-coupled neutral amino acid transporter 11 [Seminavis robusta]|uniref:Sodium-coupled neutral amino acid transporter 11 n=1 Tax=Seminavis robusta TaxID=568900 RepID=A0A9N8DRP8_9STRA|nr:Putative sodium-coupled neutral amino acid transporter 11 [Seminavis robusta]|eukprot:Sro293_g109840.1 Putative sodium-coupled neutral amino acid transporter 11 (490) ;mRNA; r:22667-24136